MSSIGYGTCDMNVDFGSEIDRQDLDNFKNFITTQQNEVLFDYILFQDFFRIKLPWPWIWPC